MWAGLSRVDLTAGLGLLLLWWFLGQIPHPIMPPVRSLKTSPQCPFPPFIFPSPGPPGWVVGDIALRALPLSTSNKFFRSSQATPSLTPMHAPRTRKSHTCACTHIPTLIPTLLLLFHRHSHPLEHTLTRRHRGPQARARQGGGCHLSLSRLLLTPHPWHAEAEGASAGYSVLVRWLLNYWLI